MSCRVAQLEGLLEEEKTGFREAKLMMKISSLSARVDETELEREKTFYSQELKVLQEKRANLEKHLLDLSYGILEKTTFNNVVNHLEFLVPYLRTFHGSFKFITKNDSS